MQKLFEELENEYLPLKTIKEKQHEEDTKRIKQYEVKKIVIGYPRNLNGTSGFRVEKTEEFIKKLIDKFNLDVIKWDEWLSTVSAHRDMNDMNIKKKKKRGIVDTIASVHILQNYLDAQRNKLNIF